MNSKIDKKPKFNESSQNKTKERFVPRKNIDDSTSSNNSKYFKNKPNKNPKYKTSTDIEPENKKTIWSERTANKASTTKESGHVNVWLKENAPEHSSKKTGALSPRAPEKIRKNRQEEVKVCGENAVNMLFSKRPQSIVRLWCSPKISHKIGNILSYLAEHKKAYHVVTNEELATVTDTEHHGGICALTKKMRPLSLTGYLQVAKPSDCVVVLDGMNNPHNIGGILRTMACFGAEAVVVENSELLFSSVSSRIADGGLDCIYPLEASSTKSGINQLREAGYQIVKLSNDKQAQAISKCNFTKKIALVITETEYKDSSPADIQINITRNSPLTNGLNVVVATGIVLAKWFNH